MSGRLVLHRQRPIRLEDQYRGPFSLCRSFLQQISWILEQWEESIRSSSVNVVGNEIAEAENSLYEIKQKLWTLCVSASSKLVLGVNQAESQENSPVCQKASQPRNLSLVKSTPSALSPHADNQLVVHDEPGQPVGIHQRESRKTVVKNNATHPPLKNLLLDWSVVLDVNNRLCLQGILLNEGEWVTSPITVRLGPNTVQTNSGTVYNVAGKMMVPQDDCLPKFVQDKFQVGFPADWESVLHQWVIAKSKNAEKVHVGRNIQKENKQNLELGVVLHNIRKDHHPQQHEMLMPPPQIVPKPRKQSSTTTVANNSPQMTVQERVQNNTMILLKNSSQLSGISKRQNITTTAVKSSPQLIAHSLPEELSEPTKHTRKPLELEVPRFSKRIISRSLREISMDESSSDLNETIPQADEVKLLSHWNAELCEEAGGLVLKGRLINEKGNVLKNDFTSNCVYRRLQSDLVETNGGDCYRLVGPSAAVYSESKIFDYGFPANWKTVFLNNAQNKQASEITAVKNRGNSFRGKRASMRSECSETSVVSTAQSSKRQSVKIQQLIKQQISQVQTGMCENNSNVGRKRMHRAMSNSQSQQENNGHVKKRKAINAVAEVNPNNESMDNVSDVSEYQWKQEVAKTLKTTKNKPAEPESASKKEDKYQESDQVSKKNNQNSKVNKQGKPTDKYVVGLLTDCESDLDFNIF